MTATTFNFVDLAIIAIIALSILAGIMRGATREVLGIAAWIGAFVIVFYGLPLLRPFGRAYFKSAMVADAVTAGGLFIISLGVFILISRLLSSSVRGSIFGGLDRSLGLVFGFIRGIVLVCLAYLSLGFFYPSENLPPFIQTARFTPWVAQGAEEFKNLIPEDYLPKDLAYPRPIDPLDAQDLLEETVKNLSTLKASSPRRPEPQYDETALEKLEGLIGENGTTEE